MPNLTLTPIPGLIEIHPAVYEDARGYFFESYNRRTFSGIGISCEFVQDNQSHSSKGVLRGLHFQRARPQAKLVRVLSGRVFDVAVDLRPGSATYKKWYGVTLCSELRNMLYIPEGFAHGFLALSEGVQVAYKCSDFYDPADEGGIPWDDPSVGIIWPDIGMEPVLSEKDRAYEKLEVRDRNGRP